MEFAAKVIDAIHANRFYVFTHPEHKDELREVFDEILADYPDGDTPPDRMSIDWSAGALPRGAPGLPRPGLAVSHPL